MAAARTESQFPATRWTLILQVRAHGDEAATQRAVTQLCNDYWYPLYAFARRMGRSPGDAQDVTQSFFAYALARNLFASAESQLGKLRTFLLRAFQRHLSDLQAHAGRLKRGGAYEFVSLDASTGEERYLREAVNEATPEKLFERSWALQTLEAALAALRLEESAAGRDGEFAEFEWFLSADCGGTPAYKSAAERLGLTEEAVRQAVSRLRKKFRATLRQRIADTLEIPSAVQVDEELAALRAALRP